jgi:hypothetical protein
MLTPLAAASLGNRLGKGCVPLCRRHVEVVCSKPRIIRRENKLIPTLQIHICPG